MDRWCVCVLEASCPAHDFYNRMGDRCVMNACLYTGPNAQTVSPTASTKHHGISYSDQALTDDPWHKYEVSPLPVISLARALATASCPS